MSVTPLPSALLAAAGRRRLRTAGILATACTMFAPLTAATLSTAACAVRRCGLVGSDRDFQAVAQSVGAVDDDALARRKSRGYGGDIAVDRAGRDLPHRDGVVGVD